MYTEQDGIYKLIYNNDKIMRDMRYFMLDMINGFTSI